MREAEKAYSIRTFSKGRGAKKKGPNCISVFNEHIVPVPLGFDVNKYINTTFRMYNAPRRQVELVCDNGVMDAIIDRFGPLCLRPAEFQSYCRDRYRQGVL